MNRPKEKRTLEELKIAYEGRCYFATNEIKDYKGAFKQKNFTDHYVKITEVKKGENRKKLYIYKGIRVNRTKKGIDNISMTINTVADTNLFAINEISSEEYVKQLKKIEPFVDILKK